MKRCATISADIVASTSLSIEEFKRLTSIIKATLKQLEKQYQGFWGRVVRGDSIECVVDNPKDGLRIALLLKSLAKSFVPSDGIRDVKFHEYGLRIAVGIGEMYLVDRKLDMMVGEAIKMSGRALDEMRKNKRTDFLQIVTDKDCYNGLLSGFSALLNQLLNTSTSRQCETLFYRLQCEKDLDVAKTMKISRAGANDNLRKIGWDAIDITLKGFEHTFDPGSKSKNEINRKEKENKEKPVVNPSQINASMANNVSAESESFPDPIFGWFRETKFVNEQIEAILIYFNQNEYNAAKSCFGEDNKSNLILLGEKGSLRQNVQKRFLLVNTIMSDDNQVQGMGNGRVTVKINSVNQGRPSKNESKHETAKNNTKIRQRERVMSKTGVSQSNKVMLYNKSVEINAKSYQNTKSIYFKHTMADIAQECFNKRIENSIIIWKEIYRLQEEQSLSQESNHKDNAIISSKVQELHQNREKKQKIKRQIRKTTPKSIVTINRKRQPKRKSNNGATGQNLGRTKVASALKQKARSLA